MYRQAIHAPSLPVVTQVLHSKNTSMTNKTSFPSKHIQDSYISDEGHSMILDISDLENINMSSTYTSESGGSSVVWRTVSPEPRQIPHRTPRPRVPSIRTPPPGLWQVSPPKSWMHMASTTSPDYLKPAHVPPSPMPTTPRPTSLTLPPSCVSQSPAYPENWWRASIPNDLLYKESGPTPGPPSGEGGFIMRKPHPLRLAAFRHLLTENKRKNKHAPSMVSTFNPLRAHVPSRAWALADVEVVSERFRTPLIPSTRVRSICDQTIREAGRTKTSYLQRTSFHCRGCKRDTYLKKHLLFGYFLRQAQSRSSPLTKIDEHAMDVDKDQNGDPSDDDLLNSPTLRDLDDFNDFDAFEDGQDAILHDIGQSFDMDLSLF